MYIRIPGHVNVWVENWFLFEKMLTSTFKTAVTTAPILRFFLWSNRAAGSTSCSAQRQLGCLPALQDATHCLGLLSSCTGWAKLCAYRKWISNYCVCQGEVWSICMVTSCTKPLEVIFSKPISKASARLQKIVLQLQHYHIRIVCTKGKSDTLSWSTVTRCSPRAPSWDQNL